MGVMLRHCPMAHHYKASQTKGGEWIGLSVCDNRGQCRWRYLSNGPHHYVTPSMHRGCVKAQDKFQNRGQVSKGRSSGPCGSSPVPRHLVCVLTGVLTGNKIRKISSNKIVFWFSASEMASQWANRPDRFTSQWIGIMTTELNQCLQSSDWFSLKQRSDLWTPFLGHTWSKDHVFCLSRQKTSAGVKVFLSDETLSLSWVKFWGRPVWWSQTVRRFSVHQLYTGMLAKLCFCSNNTTFWNQSWRNHDAVCSCGLIGAFGTIPLILGLGYFLRTSAGMVPTRLFEPWNFHLKLCSATVHVYCQCMFNYSVLVQAQKKNSRYTWFIVYARQLTCYWKTIVCFIDFHCSFLFGGWT